MNEKQIDEIIELISKEERLENEDKIEKALTKSLEDRQVAKEKAEELKMESTKCLTDEIEQQVDPMKKEIKTKIPSKVYDFVEYILLILKILSSTDNSL